MAFRRGVPRPGDPIDDYSRSGSCILSISRRSMCFWGGEVPSGVLRLEPHRAPRSQGIPCPASRLALQQVVPFESMFIFSVFRRSVGVLYLRDLI